MTALDTDDLAVVTGPLTLNEGLGHVYLTPGEVVSVVEWDDTDPIVLVFGHESDRKQWIDASSLTPLSEIQRDPDVLWGETPYVVFSDIHDYVYEGDE